MRTTEFTESAFSDIDTGYWFYEDQREGLETYFESSIMADIRALQIHAGNSRRRTSNSFRQVLQEGGSAFSVVHLLSDGWRCDPHLCGHR